MKADGPTINRQIVETPWDQEAFQMPTYEIIRLEESTLQEAEKLPGHYTVKVSPTSSKKLLHDFGYYYCDTLIEPYIQKSNFKPCFLQEVGLTKEISPEKLSLLCTNAFIHGRFHRDFQILSPLADLRYQRWARQLLQKGQVVGLTYKDEIAAFFAYAENKVHLHAVAPEYRSRGLGKYLWSAGYDFLFNSGYEECSSSISAANLAIVNLYSSLGFRFRNPVDIYHKIVG